MATTSKRSMIKTSSTTNREARNVSRFRDPGKRGEAGPLVDASIGKKLSPAEMKRQKTKASPPKGKSNAQGKKGRV